MIRFALNNLTAIFRHSYMPYERKVCLWAWNLRLVFVLVPAFGMAWWWWAWWEWPTDRWQLPTLLWAAYTIWGAGWLGGFAWADLGPGQAFIRWWLHKPDCVRPAGLTWRCCGGTSYQPNIINTTLEGWEGPKERYSELVGAWQRLKHSVLRPFDGDPSSGRFGDDE